MFSSRINIRCENINVVEILNRLCKSKCIVFRHRLGCLCHTCDRELAKVGFHSQGKSYFTVQLLSHSMQFCKRQVRFETYW